MATTILVSCPECHKQIKVPADLQGKKIRCKGCGQTFAVAGAGAKKAATDKKKTDDLPIPIKQETEYDEARPYIVTHEDLAVRCPHCAQELESSEAIICLNCGYNTITRRRHETKQTAARTKADWIIWLLPGIVCVLFVLSCATLDLTYIFFLSRWLDFQVFGEGTRLFSYPCMFFWPTVISLFFIFFAARFAFRRLILNPTPPERKVEAKKKDDD